MKKFTLLTITAISLFASSNSPYDIGVNAGVTSIKNDPNIKMEHPTFGINLQMNDYQIKPRFDFEYVNITGNKAYFPNSLLKVSTNAVIEFNPAYQTIQPYILGGFGYESVTNEKKGFRSHPFMHGGLGLDFNINESISFKTEFKALKILGGERENNEFVATVGFTIPFGTPSNKNAEPVTPVAPVSFGNKQCPVKIDRPDEDRDGVENSIDQCPHTPCDFSVDSYGCPVKATLRIHFAPDSATITHYSMEKVRRFAQFLLQNKGSLVHIVGHTDAQGSDSYNMVLSKRRADAIKQALVNIGVSESRLSTEGRGERDPIASNDTEEGRALNRRIEVTLTYPQVIKGAE